MFTINDKWMTRYLDLAKFMSTWSKDPSTKTGAVIISPDNYIVSLGYNGFAKGVEDTDERLTTREIKYRLVVHCEINAIISAKRDLTGCYLYTYPFMSCSVCTSAVIQSGIKYCIAPKTPAYQAERWAEDLKLSRQQFEEAGIYLLEVDYN